MKGYVCDRCRTAVPEDARSTLVVALSGPGTNIKTTSAIDLCERCARSIANTLNRRVITATTIPGAWRVSLDTEGDSDEHDE